LQHSLVPETKITVGDLQKRPLFSLPSIPGGCGREEPWAARSSGVGLARVQPHISAQVLGKTAGDADCHHDHDKQIEWF